MAKEPSILDYESPAPRELRPKIPLALRWMIGVIAAVVTLFTAVLLAGSATELLEFGDIQPVAYLFTLICLALSIALWRFLGVRWVLPRRRR